MTVFSFHPVKHITTGEGGMVTTNDEELYQRLLLYRNHGVSRDPDKFTASGSPFSVGQWPTTNGNREANGWYYEMQALGWNYRITDIQSALGLSQLTKMETFVQRRRFIAEQYSDSLGKLSGFRPQVEAEGYKSSYHLYVICLDTRTTLERNEVINELKRMGVGTQVHYIPVYRHPFYKRLEFTDFRCQNAEIYFRHCLSIPMYPAMSDEDISRVVNALEVVQRML
jgi:dTDP-4-amino-4,6-dideoxygalactose transaminase